MPTYIAYFRTDTDWAETTITARTPQQALTRARAFYQEHEDELLFQDYGEARPVNEIEIASDGRDGLAFWRDDDLLRRLAARDLLEALEDQTDAAQAVIDTWEKGDLAGAVRTLAALIPSARAAIAAAKGDVS
jgi:hypothetical protein